MIWLVAVGVGILTDCLLKYYLHETKYPGTVFLSLCCCTAIFIVYHDSFPLFLKGCIFSQLLIVAGYIDHRIQMIPDTICVLTAFSGLILFSPLSSLCGAAVLFVLLMGCRLTLGGIGGGDIKLFTACGVVLGLIGGLISVLLSYLFFCVTSLLLHRKWSGRYPLAPYIAAGSIITYLII